MLGVKPDLIEQLVSDPASIDDAKLQAIVQFGLRCSRNPQDLTAADFDTLRQHGMRQSQIMELIAMSAFAVYANILADATAMDPDEMFGSV